MPENKTEEVFLNLGPQHPGILGTLRLELHTNGEFVLKVIPHIGYLHRCFEKHAENLEYTKIIPFTDRMDYLSSINNNWGYVLAVEKLLGIEIPERVEYIRIIMAELNRISSHLSALGHYSLSIGDSITFTHAFKERGKIISLFEEICGVRLLYNYICVGGVSYDFTSDFIRKIKKFCNYLLPKIIKYRDLLSFNHIFIKRTANIGILSSDSAISYSVTGPNLRASGIPFDVRRNDPYSLYNRFNFEIPVGKGTMGTVGDCWDRYMVRISEIEQSIGIIQQALSDIPSGDIRMALPMPLSPRIGEVYIRTESPRGELGYYIISDGGVIPVRVKVRTPSFCTLNVLNEIACGSMIADLTTILASLDIMPAEVDR